MKRHLRSAVVVSILLLLAFCSAVRAQSYLNATGNPSFGLNIPIENGFINVANGNVHLELPLAQQPQRGNLKLDERLVYDGRIWQIAGSGYEAWQPTNVPNSMAGWRFVSGLPGGNPPTPTEVGVGACDGYGDNYSLWSFSWTDNSGTAHLFDTSWELWPDICGDYGTENATGYATDASGYSMSLSGPGDNSSPSIIIYDNNGNEVYPNAIDRFGNYWTADGNGNLIDDLGRTPVTATASGNQIVYSVLSFGGGSNTYTVTTEQIAVSTSFQQSGVSEFSGTLTTIQSIQLPDGSSYSFTYDGYGELTAMTLPTGGTVNLGYSNYQDSFYNENRWLSSYSGGHGSYSFHLGALSYCSGSQQTGCVEQMQLTDAAGNQTLYALTMNGGGAWNTAAGIYSGPASGGTMLVNTSTVYDYSQSCNTPGVCPAGAAYITKQSDNVILYDAGLQTQTLYGYNSPLGKVTSVKQWDYYAGSPPSSPTIDTEYTYSGSGHDLTQVQVLDGGGTQVSLTNYNFSATATPTSGIVGHGTPNPDGLAAPYLGSIVQWAGSAGSLSTSLTSDDTGTLLKGSGPDGQITTLSHDSTDTYITTVTPPTPLGGVSLPQSAAYDPSTGLVTSTTDPNGAQTTYSLYDWAGRVGQINYPDGGSEFFTYSPTGLTDSRTMNSGESTQRQTLLDSYGRLIRVADANGQSTNPWYQTDYCYDSNGRLQFKSYRYQGNGWSTPQVCSGGPGDTYSYDALDRLARVSGYDGVNLTYQHTGPATEVTDENGVQRIVQTNILGETTAVCEISSDSSMPGSGSPASCGTVIPGTGFLTSYAYSLANHTTTVTQGAQTRVFQTDPLGRTTFTQEPESGSTSYSYAFAPRGLPGRGLLVTRTRPRANQTNPNVLTTTWIWYDSVGRLVSVAYDDGLTPGKTYVYDTAAGSSWTNAASAANLKGRLAYVSTGATGSLFSYDTMGRVANMWECAPSICGTASQSSRPALAFSYDWAGNLTTEFDGASGSIGYGRSPAGEVTSIANYSYTVAGASNPGVANPLVSSIQNGPFGPTSYQLANGLGEAVNYDWRGRVQAKWVCSGSTQPYCSGGTSLYGFDTARIGNQISVLSDTVLNARIANTANTYDEFGRLTAASLNYGQQTFGYSYDRYGNRWAQNAPQGGPSWSGSFNVANNQIDSNGYAYDAAGNLTNDGSHSYQYDAEGDVLTVDGGNTATYVYDALNHRVSAGNADGATEFMYDFAGRRISSWIASINFGSEGRIYWDGRQIAYRSWSSPTYFEHQDWQGTERLRTDYAGVVAATYTSYPFGDGSTQTVGGTGVDQDNNSFTSLELDPETSTDHAQYRQYNPGAGSWMSPDPYAGSYDINNPQSLNRYSYVLNNPLTFTDPLGLDYGFDCGDNCVGVVGTPDPDPCGEVGNCGLDGPGGPGSPTGVPLIPTLPVNPTANSNRATNNGNVFTCAAGFADTYSIAGGLRALGIGNSGVGGFITNALGGNAFSGFTNLVSSFGSGSAGGHNVFYNMGESVVAGPLQGIPGGSGPWGASASDLATGAIAGGAFSAVTGAGQALQGLNGAASLASTGIDAAEFATGVGEVKFAADAAIYFGGLAKCAAQ